MISLRILYYLRLVTLVPVLSKQPKKTEKQKEEKFLKTDRLFIAQLFVAAKSWKLTK